MNNKSKNKIRNPSNSRESRSNLASNSKQKPNLVKYKSDKNLFFKSKNPAHNPHSKAKEHLKNSSKNISDNPPDSKLHKLTKPELPSQEYYNHVKKVKSKQKFPEQSQEEIEKQKKSYFQSLYMHKQDEDQLPDVLENSFQHLPDKPHSPFNTNLKMIKKIKLIQKHAAIDANGKFVHKDIKKSDKKIDSQQHTFSVFQNTKNSIAANTHLETKKSSHNIKMKKDKLKLKTKNSELYEAELITQNKSAMKSVIKLKKHTSSGKDPKEVKQIKEELIFSKNQQVLEIHKFRSTREATRISTQRQTIQTSTKTIQSAETESSPHFLMKNNFKSCLSESIVSYDDIIKEIEQEKLNLKILRATITNVDYLQERIRSIDFIGKVCHLMSVRREAHSLAVIFLDNYVEHIISSVMKDKERRKIFKLNEDAIDFPQLIKNLKLYAITCLLLALKMDDGLMARKLCFELNTNLEGLLKSSQSKISKKMKDSIANLNGFTSTSTTKQGRKQSVYSLGKSKTNISSMSSFKSLDQKDPRKTLKKQKEETPTKQLDTIDMESIVNVETDILLKFKFKLATKSPQYWVDILTFLWDDYINAQASWEESLYFRQHDSTSNVSYLLQILEKAFLNLEVYQFSTFTIVLALMYLIIRIKLQEQKDCENLKNLFEKYRTNLSKSTNIIFYDNIGINELYGDFLTQLNLNLSDIVNAVKYIGQFMVYESLKIFSFNNKSKQVNNRYEVHEHRLSLYQYNAEVYATALK